ncbi:MAG: AAA family ATPase [Chloroflexi bacterium]|nr:AAA family ATPase [Chloroflexota bacterium]
MSKIAVSGKGGVGKTMFSSIVAYLLVDAGQTVYAIDADPNATLAQALGFPLDLARQVVPIVEMEDLIQERTGARPGEYGGYFRLNPRVDDIPARFSVTYRGVHLMQMGNIRGAGAGCACPENTMLRALITHLLLRERETVLMDMVAGLEHLGRGTAAAVDIMFVVVEPGRRSLDVARDIATLAKDLGIPKVWIIANKVRDERDQQFIADNLGEDALEIAGWLPFDEAAIEADMTGRAVYDMAPALVAAVRDVLVRANLIDH